MHKKKNWPRLQEEPEFIAYNMGAHPGSQVHLEILGWFQWNYNCKLQREELLEFPEVRHDQITTSYTDNPVGKVVLSTEKSSL